MQNTSSSFFFHSESKASIMPRPPAYMVFLLSCLLFSLSACNKTDAKNVNAEKPADCVKIPNTPLCWQIPDGWTVKQSAQKHSHKELKSAIKETAKDAKSTEAKNNNTSKILNTYLALAGNRASTKSSLVPPTVEIYISDLKADTSATDFLAENRLSQQKALSQASIRHLEVEPVKHSQRRGFVVRDSFDVMLPKGKKVSVGQQALLLVDKNKGYVLVVTMAQTQLMQELKELRAWLNSVQFEK